MREYVRTHMHAPLPAAPSTLPTSPSIRGPPCGWSAYGGCVGNVPHHPFPARQTASSPLHLTSHRAPAEPSISSPTGPHYASWFGALLRATQGGARRRGEREKGGVPAVSDSRPLHRPAVGPSPRRSPSSIRTAAHAMHPSPHFLPSPPPPPPARPAA